MVAADGEFFGACVLEAEVAEPYLFKVCDARGIGQEFYAFVLEIVTRKVEDTKVFKTWERQ